MIKKLLFIVLVLNCIACLAQVKIDSTISTHSINYKRAAFQQGFIYCITYYDPCPNCNGTSNSQILIYDYNLNLLDSISTLETGRINVNFDRFCEFNNRLYAVATSVGGLAYDYTLHEINQFNLTDSVGVGINTSLKLGISKFEEVNPNRLRIYANELDTNSQFLISTSILEMDSLFNVVNHFRFKLDTLLPLSSPVIDLVQEVSDSVWNIYTQRAFLVFNPLKQSFEFYEYREHHIESTYQIDQNNFLAFGTVACQAPDPRFPPGNDPLGLGFLKMSNSGQVLDTISFNLFEEILNPQFTSYSSERVFVPNAVVYDTNTIYLASHNTFRSSLSNTTVKGHLFIVKTDISGKEKWRFSWGGFYLGTAMIKIVPTSDQGCIIVGNYGDLRDFISHLILIKLGPNGNVSNVEVDAPENLVAFYPNPIKEKLHFDYLPQAKGQYTLEVMDMNGKPVLETSLDEEKGFIPVQLKTGFYIYQLKDEAGKVVQVGKLVAE